MTSLPRGSHASPPVPAAGESPDHRPADALVIAGLVPMSPVAWPDHLTAPVFLQGCPWNCFYCHNQALIPARTPGQVAWEEVRALLRRRRGLLDGVVLTGGEALRQDALADAARDVIDMGFQVGLHTAGPYPRRLRDMVEAGLIDWVGIPSASPRASPVSAPRARSRAGGSAVAGSGMGEGVRGRGSGCLTEVLLAIAVPAASPAEVWLRRRTGEGHGAGRVTAAYPRGLREDRRKP